MSISKMPLTPNNTMPDHFANKAVLAYIILTPLLWASGLLIPAAVVLILFLLRKIWHYNIWKDPIVISWWMVGVAQSLSVLVNFAKSENSTGFLIHRLMSTQISGWFFLGAALALGKYFRLDSKFITRAASILGLYFIIFAIISALCMIWLPSLEISTPLLSLIPESLSAAKSFYFTMKFYRVDSLFGKEFPRLILFYPWPVMLGFAAISVFLISLNEGRVVWRFIGLFGGLVALIGSGSRVAFVAFVLIILSFPFLRVRRTVFCLALPIISILFTVFLIRNFSIFDSLNNMYDFLINSRSGSSLARQLCYQASWEGFLESPVIGQGWVGDIISENIPIPIGSHSSFYGILYTGGVITFAAFCVAFAMTLITLFHQSRLGMLKEKCAFLIAFSLAIIAPVEGIYSYVLPCVFAFFFIGGALAVTHEKLSLRSIRSIDKIGQFSE